MKVNGNKVAVVKLLQEKAELILCHESILEYPGIDLCIYNDHLVIEPLADAYERYVIPWDAIRELDVETGEDCCVIEILTNSAYIKVRGSEEHD